MRRREFIALVSGTVATWPLAAQAQQPVPMRRVAVLLATTADDTDSQARVGAFLQGMQEVGWAIGRNLRIDTRWAGADGQRYSQTRGGIGCARTRRHRCHWHLDRA